MLSFKQVITMDIWIRPRGSETWTRPSPAMRDAYVNYKERTPYYVETPYITRHYIVYRLNNDPGLPTYIARMDDIDPLAEVDREGSANHNIVRQDVHDRLTTAVPVIDMCNVYAFILDNLLGNYAASRARWVPCCEYQSWAYRDFVYDRHNSIKKSYESRGTRRVIPFNSSVLINQLVTIDLPDLLPNIEFNLFRNENNSVFFERTDSLGSRVRICDNEYVRDRYFEHYTRVTTDMGIVAAPLPTFPPASSASPASSCLLSSDHLLPQRATGDEAIQCIICNTYEINVKFSPCEHAVCCSGCYSRLSKNVCPVCRGSIMKLLHP